MPYVAICQRTVPNCSRNRNLTYVNVVSSVRWLNTTAADFVSANPTHPWADGGYHEFIIDLTDQQAAAINSGANPLFYDGHGNLPRWQQQTATSGATPSVGSFADPTSSASAFTAATPLPDDRLIVRLYDGDPGAAGIHLAALDLDEGQDAGQKTIHLKLFTQNDVPSTTNVQDAKTEIAGKLFIFDFTSGVTTFLVSTAKIGTVIFPSGHQYRVIGPAGENFVRFRVFGRLLEMDK